MIRTMKGEKSNFQIRASSIKPICTHKYVGKGAQKLFAKQLNLQIHKVVIQTKFTKNPSQIALTTIRMVIDTA